MPISSNIPVVAGRTPMPRDVPVPVPVPELGNEARLGHRARRLVSPALAALAVLIAFAATATGAGGGAGEATALDTDLVPIVRFMGGTKLVAALCVAMVAGLRYRDAARRRRRVAGFGAAVPMGLGAGLIWSGTSFAGGALVFLTGMAVVALIVMKELQASLRRRP